jgi:hypothetical protein
MTLSAIKDRLQQQFEKNLPVVDSDRGWDRLQARLAERPSFEVTRRRRRRHSSLAIAAGLAVIIIVVASAVAFTLLRGETKVASIDGPTSTASAPTSMTSPATDTTSAPSTSTTEPSVETTSPGWAARSRAATGYSSHLGKSIISYLNGEQDLASVQRLVASSAQDGLALMLSSLSRPTSCKVTRTAGADSSNVVQVWLRFFEADNQESDFSLTAVVEREDVTITAIERGAVPGP